MNDFFTAQDAIINIDNDNLDVKEELYEDLESLFDQNETQVQEAEQEN